LRKDKMKPERIRYMRDYFRDYLPSATMRIASRLAHEVLDDIERLQAENARLKAAFGPTIEAMESAERRLKDVEQWDHNGYGEPYNSIVKKLARIRAIVEKGTE